MSYILFTENGTSDSGKTKRWVVTSVAGGPKLGDVRWYGPWRKYVFETTHSIFDNECLGEVLEFIKQETSKHYKTIKMPATSEE